RDLIIGERIPYETSRAGRIEYGSRRIIDLSLPHGSAAAIGTDLRSQQCREVACALRLVRNRGLRGKTLAIFQTLVICRKKPSRLPAVHQLRDNDRAAHKKSKLVLPERQRRVAEVIIEKVASAEFVVAQEFPD